MTSSTLASEFVTDTMALVLRMESRKLGTVARSILESVEAGKVRVFVPSMVFAEILYLAEGGKINTSLSAVQGYLQKYPNCREHPMDIAVVRSAAEITDIPELHDRLIAGSARLLNLQLITNDPAIQASAFVKTIW